MKYYLVFNVMFNNGTKDSNSTYTYETRNEAIANFHKQIGGWALKDEVEHILAVVINSAGGIEKNETYDKYHEPVIEEEETV